MFCTCSSPNLRFATAAYHFSTSELQKVLQTPHVLYIFTSKCTFRHSGVHFFDIWTSKSAPDLQFFNIFTCKCAFRHSGVPFFDIWTSKSAPNTSCFVHFYLQMCFSPQRRAFFRHLNFKKCSGVSSLLTFSLPKVLFATAACNFWLLLWAPTSTPAALTGIPRLL